MLWNGKVENCLVKTHVEKKNYVFSNYFKTATVNRNHSETIKSYIKIVIIQITLHNEISLVNECVNSLTKILE